MDPKVKTLLNAKDFAISDSDELEQVFGEFKGSEAGLSECLARGEGAL